jgi:hypothetical protein
LLQVGAEGHRRPSAGGREALGAIASRPVASGWRQSRGMVASWWRRPRGGGRRRFGGGGNRRSSCRAQQELFCVLLTVPRGARREGKGKHPIKKNSFVGLATYTRRLTDEHMRPNRISTGSYVRRLTKNIQGVSSSVFATDAYSNIIFLGIEECTLFLCR